MDANRIFVMGNGLVLEQGTHNELLRDENRPYARLVAAQKVREQRDIELKDSDSDTAASDEVQDMEKKAQNEIPLGRQNTGSRSLASEIIEEKKKTQNDEQTDDHSLSYLFMRMGKLNRSDWKSYMLGSVAACSMYSSVRCFITDLTFLDSHGHGLSGLRPCLCQRYQWVLRC
jgi:ATP-binding cassette subfamily B (MDR/TAP) protein 1